MSSWIMANRLQLNPAKTEVIWCSVLRCQHLIHTGHFRINNTFITPVHSVRDLEVYLDADVTKRTHVIAPVRSCFAALRQIRSIRRFLTRHAWLTLIRALVSKIDYCNSVLTIISGHLMDMVQSVLNAAGRLVFSARRSDHITPLLREFHWIRVPERIQFRLFVCWHTAPSTVQRRLISPRASI